MTWFGIETLMMLILFIIFIPVSALILMLSATLFKLEDTSFKTAIQVALLIGVTNLLASWITTNTVSTLVSNIISYFITIVVGILVIKQIYGLELKKTLLVWLVWFILNGIAMVVISIVLGLIFGLAIVAGA